MTTLFITAVIMLGLALLTAIFYDASWRYSEVVLIALLGMVPGMLLGALVNVLLKPSFNGILLFGIITGAYAGLRFIFLIFLPDCRAEDDLRNQGTPKSTLTLNRQG